MHHELFQLAPEMAEQESAAIDFKASFDPNSTRDWCELTKDLVAMANSGGGLIVVGLNDDGTPSHADTQIVLDLDPAQITDKFHKYTEQQFGDFSIRPVLRSDVRVALISVGGARIPFCFIRPGQYEVDGRQKSAFAQGTVYFRHGAKSEPGTTDDFRQSMERELKRVREFWLDGIAKVVEAPAGSSVKIYPPEVELRSVDEATPIRLTTEETAQTFKVIEFDKLYPYRQKELVAAVKAKLGNGVVSPHDIQIIRRLHNIDADPTYSGQSKYGSRQYSDAFLDWLISCFGTDSAFFQRERDSYRRRNET